MFMRLTFTLLALAAVLFASGCSPCTEYCEEQCFCDGDTAEGCADACLETLEVYSPDVRDDECTLRLDELQEECR
jgi:hypothetical protein